jgi:Flp pilus assembly protein TadG
VLKLNARDNKKGRFRNVSRFCHDEDGSYTIEFVIWMPIFAILLAIVMNLSMIFYYESQMLRVVQDATRAFALGRFVVTQDSPPADEQAEQYILNNLAFTGANLTVDVNTGNGSSGIGVVQTVVSTNAAELMPFNLMRGAFDGIPIGVSTQYIIEF